ncbi:APC family permease [Geomonas sp. RF6]|uniref:APC family permease n=1 Tax=Geomonas sp. RF6 TaxID=2897342 RepID=UPI001E2C1740|nr:APC family permease [Geomonas sp. RF6]UFS71939.1 APC family permease [Geomonas sp. RF6]
MNSKLLKEAIFGKRLRTEEEETEQLSTMPAIPVVGLDALASAAYGPEAALTVLIVLGNVGSRYITPIVGCIIVLLTLVALSYRQTIPAYPQGGGSYTVASQNLGTLPGLLAGTALCIDYILNVAVATSAGVAALVSAVPRLLPYTLPLCLGLLLFLIVVNLRGVRSAGILFLVPTYLFIGCLAVTVAIGLYNVVATHGHPVPVRPPPVVPVSVHSAGAWLLLRAFASGCTALTGVEAVSDAVPIFREPRTVRAKRTLTVIMAVLAFLLAGIAILAHYYGITATSPGQSGYQSVLSQIIGAVAGRGAFYYLAISSILAVLLLSANTSFADFPRVCRLLALDTFLPAEFAHRGRRLVFSAGIIVLGIFSALLLVAFGGVTDRLIPLFAVGAFTAFTLSQLGMVFHWKRSEEKNARHRMILNGIGAVTTGVTLIVIAVAKFAEGAWLTIIVMPLLLVVFLRIRRYHESIEQKLEEVDGPLELEDIPAPIMVVPLKRLNRVTRKAIRVGLSFGLNVFAVQVVAEEANMEDLTERWRALVEEPARQAGQPVPKLVVVSSPYREFFGPLSHQVKVLSEHYPDRQVAVIIPELVEKRWYNFLFRHRATLLRELILLRGGPQILIITVPWYVGKKDKFEG